MPIHKWGPKTIIETDHACGNPLRSLGFVAGPSTAGEFVHRETESRSALVRPLARPIINTGMENLNLKCT